MRKDQLESLARLSEKLADVVLEEADPDNWPAAGIPLAEQSKDDRGDRYWAKKNASATFSMLITVEKLALNSKEALGRDPYPEADMDKHIAQAEANAAKLLDKVQKEAKRKEFMGRATHGKHTH